MQIDVLNADRQSKYSLLSIHGAPAGREWTKRFGLFFHLSTNMFETNSYQFGFCRESLPVLLNSIYLAKELITLLAASVHSSANGLTANTAQKASGSCAACKVRMNSGLSKCKRWIEKLFFPPKPPNFPPPRATDPRNFSSGLFLAVFLAVHPALPAPLRAALPGPRVPMAPQDVPAAMSTEGLPETSRSLIYNLKTVLFCLGCFNQQFALAKNTIPL